MKRCVPVLLAVALLTPAAFAQTTKKYLVMTRGSAPEALRTMRGDDWVPRERAEIRVFANVDAFAADLTDAEVAKLSKSKSVSFIEPAMERHMLSDSITPGAQVTPFGVNMVHAPDVWPVTKGLALDGATKIRVAVIDTGTRYTEPELRGAYKGGHNFIDGSDNPLDDEGHGTHVAGTIVAADDASGVIGIAPAVELYSLKVLDQCGSGDTVSTVAAMDWVIAKKKEIGGNWIVNLSLGSPSRSTVEEKAFQRAADAGILVFAASGNDYDTNPVDVLSFPAGYSTVESVGAVDSSAVVAGFSQRGTGLKVVGPGVDVLSTYVSGSIDTSLGDQFQAIEMSATSANGSSLCFTRPTPAASGFVYCGRGNPAEFPASVKGKVALIERGDLTFAEKAKNAKTAGAIAVIVYNNVAGALNGTVGTLTSTSQVPYTVGISQADGERLKANPNATVTLGFGLEGFALLQGTSMSCPHAVGVAALVWAVAPTATATQIAQAIETTATDLGAAGYDTVYGNGLVNALAAAKKLNPAAFSSPAQPANKPVTGRVPGRRGH